MRAILLAVALALASPAAAQTPLCVWSGTGLICPGSAPASGSLSGVEPLGVLPAPEQRMTDLQSRADLDRAVSAAQAEQARRQAEIEQRAAALIAAGDCPAAETLVRERGQGDLAGLMSRCAAAHR